MEWQKHAESLREYTIEISISYIKHINLWPSNELMTGVFVGKVIVIKCVGVVSFLGVRLLATSMSSTFV
jgi:hypothetical protein